jgi:hypothetical protein
VKKWFAGKPASFRHFELVLKVSSKRSLTGCSFLVGRQKPAAEVST